MSSDPNNEQILKSSKMKQNVSSDQTIIKNMFVCQNATDLKKQARPKYFFAEKIVTFFCTSSRSEIFRFPTVNLFLKFYIIPMFEL